MTDVSGHDIKLSKNRVKGIGKRYSDRITDDAAVYVAYWLEKEAEDLWKVAKELSEHAGRKTVMEEDIRLAEKIMGE